jgi:nitrogen-specific signal transduction histidine kinase
MSSSEAPTCCASRSHINARPLTNVVENAVHAMPAEGSLTVTVSETSAAECADTGAGMAPEAIERAFKPLFSTKMTETEFGLPIARRNVELCHGTIGVVSAPGRGTVVAVSLPRADSASAGGRQLGRRVLVLPGPTESTPSHPDERRRDIRVCRQHQHGFRSRR